MCLKITNIILIISFLFIFCKEEKITGIEVKMEIIESLMQIDNDASYFVVDTAVSFVPLLHSGGLTDNRMINKAGASFFTPGDNFQVLSLGFTLPLSFEIYNVLTIAAKDNPAIQMEAVTRLGAAVTLEPGLLYIPMPNFELNYGTFYNAFNDEIELHMALRDTINISMINVPASLHGVTFHVPIFAKVMHNIDLIP